MLQNCTEDVMYSFGTVQYDVSSEILVYCVGWGGEWANYCHRIWILTPTVP